MIEQRFFFCVWCVLNVYVPHCVHSGGRMATYIGGTLTGRGADWIIIDDPQKSVDASSESQHAKLNEWYGSTLYSRLIGCSALIENSTLKFPQKEAPW